MKMSPKGFTLIELVVVVVILGVLAVSASSRFVNLQDDAKAATLESVGGAMQAGIDLIYSKALAQGQTQASGNITIDGTPITLKYGFPAVDGSDSFTDINNQVLTYLAVDAVDRNTANANRDAALFFTDKWSSENIIYIFFAEDYDKKSVNFACRVEYRNNANGADITPQVRVFTSAC